MNIIIGISHPKHVYIFKNLYFKLVKANHQVLVLVSNKEMTCELLDVFGISYILMGANKRKMIWKLLQVIKYSFITLFYAVKFKTNIFIGAGYIHFALVSFILRKPFIFPEDTEVAKNLHKIILPFTSSFLTTKNFKNKISHKQISLNANLELAYLHPNYQIDGSKNSNSERYVLLRFVSWDAFHDAGHRGLSQNTKEILVNELLKHVKVYIASEKELPSHLEKYKLKIDPSSIHDFVAHADLVLGESPTMTTEAAMLGTPAICISSWACGLGNFEELQKEDMIYCFTPLEENNAVKKALELIADNKTKEIWRNKAIKFINERIDLTSFLFWFIENYPLSHKTMIENPDYQNRFK